MARIAAVLANESCFPDWVEITKIIIDIFQPLLGKLQWLMKVLFSVAQKHIYETPVNGAFVWGLNWLYFRQELDPSLEEFGFLFGKENEVTVCSSVLFSNKEDHEIAYYYLHISNPKCNNDCL